MELNSIKSKAKTNSWILVAIYLSIFICSYVFFKNPFEFYLGYLIYIVLLPVFIYRYGFNSSLVGIFLVLFITGLFNIMLGANTAVLFFKVFTGLVLAYFFYYYVILEFNYDVVQLFKWYLKGAYICAVIGLIQFISFQIGFRPGYDFSWIFNKWGLIIGGNFGIRINSVFPEPTYLASTLSAAFFVSVYNLFRRDTFYLSKLQCVVIIAAYILSFSGVGQLGVFLSLIFLGVSFGFLRYMLLIIPLALILFNFLYNNVQEFKGRYDGIVGLFSGEEFKLGKTHGSSFILYNNYQVTLKNFQTNPFFGSGIGSHPVAFEKYSLARNFKVFGFNANGADANSMLLRLISETGLFGTGIFLFITFRCYVRRDDRYDSDHWIVSNAILVMILLNLLRQGHYFLLGFPFFFLLYYFNYTSYVQFVEKTNFDSKKNAADILNISDR